jgi:hypothetical protein
MKHTTNKNYQFATPGITQLAMPARFEASPAAYGP